MPSRKALRVFLSFHGSASQAVARALFAWLKELSPLIKPFMSEFDMNAGTFAPQLLKALRESDAGIACLTHENLGAEWIQFESGGIATRDNREPLCLFGMDISPSDLYQPLASFQLFQGDWAGVRKLCVFLATRAKRVGVVIDDFLVRAQNAFPSFEASMNKIREAYGISPHVRHRIPAGQAVDYKRMIDLPTTEVVFAGQNLQGLMRIDMPNHIVDLIEERPRFRGLFLLTVPQFFDCISSSAKERKNFRAQYCDTVSRLLRARARLSPANVERLRVFAHPGASSLSAFFRDPTNFERGFVAFTPKWATDDQPDNRICCMIWRRQHEAMFLALYGHVGIMNDKVHSKTLDQLAKSLGVRV